MEMNMDMVRRYKVKAEIFLKNKIPAFIENITNDYFFCDILEVSEDYIKVYNFEGKRKGETDRIFFIDIIKFTEKEGGEK